METFCSHLIFLTFLGILSLHGSNGESLQSEDNANKISGFPGLQTKEAKTYLRVKRGFFKRITGEERDEEREAAQRERNREAGERNRENALRLDRFKASAKIQRLPRFMQNTIGQKTAKSLLRVKRSWLGDRWDEVTGKARRERNRESGERGREAQERNNEAANAARLDRVCPTTCWNGWPAAWEGCSMACGGGGIQWQTRTVKVGAALGECLAWVGARGCPGVNRRSQACNRFCHNNGTPHATGCTCPAGWIGQCCETRVVCPSPGSPANGVATPGGSGLHYGTVVRFGCNVGYTLVGPASRTCAASGQWTNSVPACNINSCGNPGTPANAKLELVSGTAYVYGSSVKVSCDNGYRQLGTSIRQCAASGSWSGTAPSCQLIVCPEQPAPANGVVTYPSGRNLGNNLLYACNAGYVLQGSSTRQCQSNDQWTSAAATCEQIFCNNLAAPTNGQVTHGGTSGGKTPFGQKATFSCDQGYILQGTASLTCTGTTALGKFDGQPPTCAAVSCGDPGNPTNGVRSGAGFTFGQTVTFTCSPGHYLQGQESITCQHTGQWSQPKPQCTPCGVNTFKPGTNALRTCTSCPANSGTGTSTAATAATQCLCVRGYKGNPGGPCSLIQCPAIPTPTNGRQVSCGNKLDEKCVFDCNAGHIISRGDVERTCTVNEIWTGNDVQCDACTKDTYKLTASQCEICPNNSQTTGTGNEKSGCLCNTGYQGPAGGPCNDIDECSAGNGGCEQTCINRPGDYTCECTNAGSVKDLNDQTKCVAKNRCPDIRKPSDGGVVCYAQRRTNTERCFVKCNNGFEHLETPNAYEECGPSTNWKWSYEVKNLPLPDCIPAFFEGIQLQIEVFYFTTDCDSLTDDKKQKIADDFVAMLTKKGVCKQSDQQACSIDDIDIDCGGTSGGFPFRRKRDATEEITVTFKLRTGGQALPQDRECNENCKERMKNESKAMILDEAKTITDILKQTSVEKKTVTLGGVQLEQTDRVIVSEAEPSCAKGLTHKNGTCVPISCGLPAPPTNGGMTVQGHLYGNTTTFTCSQYYALQGDSSTTCLANGNWSAYTTACVHYKDLNYDCQDNNPCTPRRIPDRYYYKHVDTDKFIHCGVGTCYERTCPKPLFWSNKLLVCVWSWQLA